MSDDDDDLFRGADAAKREGMQRAWENADETWKRVMYDLLLQTARSKQEFTTDEIFVRYYALGNPPQTDDDRALGPLMALAVKNGICRKIGPVSSRRRSRHKGFTTLWRSRIFGKPDYLSSPMPEAPAGPLPTNAYLDAGGRLIKEKCGVEGCQESPSCSIGFFPRKGQFGMWYCLEHWKELNNLETKV
jgi:hypothetical protein